jgi:hypothetical protein
LSLKDGQLISKDFLLSDAEKSIQAKTELLSLQEQLNNGLKSENKKLKKGRWFDNYIVKPLLFVGGVYVGKKLLN